MSVLNRAQILARKPKIVLVPLPGSDDGEQVAIRRMSALDWERIKERSKDQQRFGLQLAMIICDENGQRQFDPDNADDVKACADQFALIETGDILRAARKLAVPAVKEDIKKLRDDPALRFSYELTLALKIGTREETMERLSADEFFGWMAFAELNPFGEAREDLRAAIFWSTYATVHSDSKKHPRGIGIEKYPLMELQSRLDKPEVKATPESLFRALKLLSQMYPAS